MNFSVRQQFFCQLPSFHFSSFLSPCPFSPYDRHIATWLEPHVHMFLPGGKKKRPRNSKEKEAWEKRRKESFCHHEPQLNSLSPCLEAHYIVTKIFIFPIATFPSWMYVSLLPLGIISSNKKSREDGLSWNHQGKENRLQQDSWFYPQQLLNRSTILQTAFVDRSDRIET